MVYVRLLPVAAFRRGANQRDLPRLLSGVFFSYVESEDRSLGQPFPLANTRLAENVSCAPWTGDVCEILY